MTKVTAAIRQTDIQTSKNIERGLWKSKTEFLLSCLGYAIGIGNVWRFPYLCYRNGGGAFLVPYLLMLVICGIPLFYLETSIGQFSSTGCITMFKISPLFKGVGYAILVVNILCTSYYSLILTYPLLFLKHSFSQILPWENCNNTWNTEKCVKLFGDDIRNVTVLQNSSVSTSADEFFHNEILQISSGLDDIGTIVWPVFWGNAVSWIVIFLCIAKGVKSVGKVVYFTATFPYVILFVLFIRGITLPGALKGITFYISPDWSQLANLRVWADAAIQIFYSLGPGWGGIVSMASYNKFNNNNLIDSFTIPIVNCGTSIFAGFVVFSVVGFMSEMTGLPVATVATGGPALAFITYPSAITMLPWANLWSILFFSMLFFLGIDSCFVQVETIISAVVDNFPILRKQKTIITFLTCIFFFLASMICTTNGGMYVLQLLDWYSASIPVILICFLEIFVIGWVYGIRNFIRDIEFMNKRKVHWIWLLFWKFITPSILIFIFFTTIIWNVTITYKGKPFPSWSIAIGWVTCATSIICIPIYMVYYLMYRTKGPLKQRLKTALKAKRGWCPNDSENATQWIKLLSKEKPEQLTDEL